MTDQSNNVIEDTKPANEVQVQPQSTSLVEPEKVQDVNWKLFRETRQKERKEKEDAEARARQKEAEAQALKEALEAIVNKKSYDQTQSETEETEEQKYKKHIDKYLAEKEQENERNRMEKERQQMPNKLADTFGDFNNVCTSDNLDYLEYHYPEVAAAYKHQPDSFEKWANLYKAVKRFVPNTDSKKDQAKAERNFNKPQAISRPGATPTGDTPPINLDDKRRADNWRRMQKTMKGA